MDYSHLDPESRALVFELQLEDLTAPSSPVENKGKGKQVEDATASDFELALRLQNLEVVNAAQVDVDDQVARAVNERPEADDATARNGEPNFWVEPGLLERWKRFEDLKKAPFPPTDTAADLLEFEDDENGTAEAASSSRAATEKNDAGSPKVSCLACTEEHPAAETAECPCTHTFCRECLQGLFKAALSDESLFPPQCCQQQIPVEAVKDLVGPAAVKAYEAKRIEFGTPAPNRTYCNGCSAFIPADLVQVTDDVATCPKCSHKTCRLCKAATHPGECLTDEGVQQVLELGKAEGWQRCSSCGSMVELQVGCNHMTCRCGAQFCYVCGEKWKTCLCPQWQENRLLARPHRPDDHHHQQNMGANPYRPMRPYMMEEELLPPQGRRLNGRDAWEMYQPAGPRCDHGVAERRRGAYMCRECLRHMVHFIMVCGDCNVMICRDCQWLSVHAPQLLFRDVQGNARRRNPPPPPPPPPRDPWDGPDPLANYIGHR
ncbi:protein ariadne-2 [Rhypophila sp. PSN 637]